MNILVFTSVHPPNDVRIFKQVTSLANNGYLLTLCAPWQGSTLNTSVDKRYFKQYSGIRGRLEAQLKFLKLAFFGKFDVIHFHDFDTVISAALVALLTRKAVVYDVHENYAEEVLTRNYIPSFLKKPLYHIVNILERLCVKVIKNLIVVVPEQEKRFKEWGVKNLIMVKNFPSIGFAPASKNDLKIDHDNDCYVLNVGGQTVNYGSLLLVEALILIKEKGIEIPVVGIDRFEGSGNLRGQIKAKIRDYNLNYRLLPRVSHDRMGELFKNAKIGLSLRLDTPNQRMGIPNKIFEYMAFGIPIIATDVGHQATIINDSNSGCLVSPYDSHELAEAIINLWDNLDLRCLYGHHGRKAFYHSYCWDGEASKLINFYQRLSI